MLDPRWIGRKKRLKAYAEANGIPVPKGYRLTPTLGSAARELIRRVQRKLYGEAGVTGKWNGGLDAAIAPKMTYAKKMVQTARGEIGVVESPRNSNSGERVREYQAATNLGGTGWPWCAALCAWCSERSGHVFRGWNTAYVPDYVSTARAGKHGLRVVSADDARPGDLVCFDWDGGVADHIGILESYVRSGRFTAIEGNTAYGNDSNGGQVMRRDRNTSQVECFIRVDR
jgi:cell wall-associated NlpC family hydrolase